MNTSIPLPANYSFGRSGDRVSGQVHGVARHVPERGEGLAARLFAVQATAHRQVDRQLRPGRDEAAQGTQYNTPLFFSGWPSQTIAQFVAVYTIVKTGVDVPGEL